MNKILLTATMVLAGAAGMSAQGYHGFALNASRELVSNRIGTSGNAIRMLSASADQHKRTITVMPIFEPQHKVLTPNEEKTEFTEIGSWLSYNESDGTFTDLFSLTAASKNTVAGTLDGIVLTATMGDDGLMYVTIPETCYVNGVLTPVTQGDLCFRLDTYKSPYRIGDKDAYTNEGMNGTYATVSAPEGVRVTVDYIQANTTTAFNMPYEGYEAYADCLGGCPRTAVFELGTIPAGKGNQPVDLQSSGPATHGDNILKYRRRDKTNPSVLTDTRGFPMRWVDIVFYGVKPGDRIGWTNLQSLHDGYTPVPYKGK